MHTLAHFTLSYMIGRFPSHLLFVIFDGVLLIFYYKKIAFSSFQWHENNVTKYFQHHKFGSQNLLTLVCGVIIMVTMIIVTLMSPKLWCYSIRMFCDTILVSMIILTKLLVFYFLFKNIKLNVAYCFARIYWQLRL